MSEQFRAGDICILQHIEFNPQYNGEECTIVEPLAVRTYVNPRTGGSTKRALYRIICDGRRWSVLPHQLRRRPPSDSHERTYMQLWRDMAGKAPQRQGETV